MKPTCRSVVRFNFAYSSDLKLYSTPLKLNTFESASGIVSIFVFIFSSETVIHGVVPPAHPFASRAHPITAVLPPTKPARTPTPETLFENPFTPSPPDIVGDVLVAFKARPITADEA